ncbi:MAG: hypothetical protein GY749_35375 [Desulfobacteraceae bacterium]|nr:hypothetical protein [Desulfobacteraceae bacterium]
MNLNTLLAQADSLRFKLLGIIGRDEGKKKKIIEYLCTIGWKTVDAESELLPIRAELDNGGIENVFELGTKIKEWFNSKPSNLVLTNASILYHDMFLKISPVGAFKYNSRNKNCVLFLEDEKRVGKRIYHSQIGAADYYDQEINDIILADLEQIDDNFEIKTEIREVVRDYDRLNKDAIGRLFNFQQIKDVIDIDSDLNESGKRADLVKSYVISESLEMQIAEFFDNLEKPSHKACTVIGNYGSGKSHLVGFLISLTEEPALVRFIRSEKIRQAVGKLSRKFYSVQFELQAGQVDLKEWFFGSVRRQLKAKYQIDIPVFDPVKDFDDKENIKTVLDIVKTKDPSVGLLVIIDEISDFLATRQKEAMKADLQFLRVIGQICQAQDLMFVGSMQEDVFTGSKFKDVASEIGRIGERFQNIIIHKEDIKKVICERIVPKTSEQRHKLEQKFSEYAEKIDDVSRNIDEYVDLFPLTPFLLDLFSDLPYFDKRGAIQFAIHEIKYLLNEPFPYFITFEKIYDILENDPNKRNLEEIYKITKVMGILDQKVNLLEKKFRNDAVKIIKGLSVYSLWDRREKGSTARELANNLMLVPQKKLFTAADHISLIVKKIRDVTEGEYIKTSKDESTGLEHFKFVTKAGVDPEQKIEQKAAGVSDSEIEYELFYQLAEILELDRVNGHSDVFHDECEWKSVKSFRKGYIIFVKENSEFSALPDRDYAIVFLSPFVTQFSRKFACDQLCIKLKISVAENIERIKQIVAIKALINSNFNKSQMLRKLDGRINGYFAGQKKITGFKHSFLKLLMNKAECDFNGRPESIKFHIGRERNNVPEIIDELKASVFDGQFNKAYPLHPKYSIQLSSVNIVPSLNPIASELTKGDFTNLSPSVRSFLRSVSLLDQQDYPDISQSKIVACLLDKIKANKKKVTDIQKELVEPLCASQYGSEPEIVRFVLVVMTVMGRIFLQAKGGDKIDINNIKDKFKSLAAFETIAYAKIQEDYSYDFAARLLNALGLNGIRITLEKERLNAFKEYREKTDSVLKEIQSFEETVNQLRQRPTVHIDIAAVQKEFDNIQAINWKGLDIANHTRFGTLESMYNPLLPKITIALKDLKEIMSAVSEYEKDIHNAIGYMNNALELLGKHGLVVTDIKKYDAVKNFRDEAVMICSDFERFKDLSQRNPIRGKIQQFKKSYIFDFYYAAHEKYVGRKVDWTKLTSYQAHPVFQRLKLLNDVTCISDTKFRQLVLRWNELAQHRCDNSDLEDQLLTGVRCPKCLFPKQDIVYSAILAEIDKIESDLGELFRSYEKSIIREIREYRNNIQFLDNDAEKELIQNMLKSGKLPDTISMPDISAINKLFKEIDVVEIDADLVIKALFSSQEMTTLEELRKRFYALEHDIKKNRQENEVRIKLK